jgi:hypothetical protein
MQQKLLKYSLTSGFVTAVYFLPQIVQHGSSPWVMMGGYAVQAFHDAVCLFFFVLYLQSFDKDIRYLLCLKWFT